MSEIRVIVRDTYLDAYANNVVSGAVGTVPCIFDFDESWDGYAKTVVFYKGSENQIKLSKTVSLLSDETSCDTPFEVLLSAEPLYIGLYGTKDNKVKPTNWSIVNLPEGTYSANTLPPPASPDVYIQLLNKIEQYKQDNSESAAAAAASAAEANSYAQDAQASAESAATYAQDAQASAERAAISEQNIQNAEADVLALKNSIETAEPARVAAESARVAAEQDRVNAETARKNAENARKNAETVRVNAESERQSAELARASAETARASAESARVTAEQGRVAAEAARQAYHESLQPYLNTFIETIGIGVEYGLEVTPTSPPSNFVNVSAGAARISNGQRFVINSMSINPTVGSDAINNRKAIIYLDSSGNVATLLGDVDGSVPATPAGGLLLYEVDVRDGTYPINASMLTDKRKFTIGLYSPVKNKSFESVGARMNEIEEDAQVLESRVEQTENEINILQNRVTAAEEGKADKSALSETNLRIATINKFLSDYQNAIASININQSPKQTAAGYGTVSLPVNAANGQVSDVKLKGLTATNLVKNGNFNGGVSSWISIDSTINAENNMCHMLATVKNGRIIQTLNVLVRNKYYLAAKIKSNSNLVGLGVSKTILSAHSGSGSFETISTIYTPAVSPIYPSVVDSRDDSFDEIQIKEYFVVNLTQTFGSGNEPTVEQCDKMFSHWFDSTKSTVSAMRIRIVSEDEAEGSTSYVLAKDEDGNIEELRSLPNGTKDEVRVSEGKLIKRVSDWFTTKDTLVIQGIAGVEWQSEGMTSVYFTFDNFTPRIDNIYQGVLVAGAAFSPQFLHSGWQFSGTPGVECFAMRGDSRLFYLRVLNSKTGVLDTDDDATKKSKIQTWLRSNPITLIYQLATPIEIPIQTSGSLVSYPSGTVYIEPFVADAGIYTDKMEVLHSDLPIKALEKISKVDFDTGLETELDVSDAVIAENKLSFTHPDLVDGDIVFFTYEYDRESTEGEMEIEYYDSRYVIKDSVTGKFYKWHIAVADGVPSIELTEV